MMMALVIEKPEKHEITKRTELQTKLNAIKAYRTRMKIGDNYGTNDAYHCKNDSGTI